MRGQAKMPLLQAQLHKPCPICDERWPSMACGHTLDEIAAHQAHIDATPDGPVLRLVVSND
jgi:hypothetical protein